MWEGVVGGGGVDGDDRVGHGRRWTRVGRRLVTRQGVCGRMRQGVG